MPLRSRPLLTTAVPLLAGWWLLRDRPVPGDATPTVPSGDRPRTLAVVVPARNEERALPVLLASLRAQTRAPDRLVVVDDHSEDATGAVARDQGATVVEPPPLAEGWVGKTWALHHGAAGVDADLLVFLDADVVLAPGALAAIEAEHAVGGGLVSVQPEHRTVSAHEQLSAVCNVVAVTGTGAFTGAHRWPVAMAFGPCLAMSRDDYDAIGGHGDPSVRLQVAEDIAMARLMAARGRPVRLFAGGDLIGFRMYPDGVRSLVEGWTKMLGNGGRRTSPVVLAAVVVWLTGALVGAGRGARMAARLVRCRRPRTGDVAAYAAWAAEMSWLFGRVGRWRRTTALAFPAPLLAFVALFARSAGLVASGRPARWRGRDVPAG